MQIVRGNVAMPFMQRNRMQYGIGISGTQSINQTRLYSFVYVVAVNNALPVIFAFVLSQLPRAIDGCGSTTHF